MCYLRYHQILLLCPFSAGTVAKRAFLRTQSIFLHSQSLWGCWIVCVRGRGQRSPGLGGTHGEWQEDPPHLLRTLHPETLTSLVPCGYSATAGICHFRETRHQKKRWALWAKLHSKVTTGPSMRRLNRPLLLSHSDQKACALIPANSIAASRWTNWPQRLDTHFRPLTVLSSWHHQLKLEEELQPALLLRLFR